MKIKIKKYNKGPIISPEISSELGQNIQGPSIIKKPEWINNKLGKYLLYFADHKGDHIKLAHSNNLFHSWEIYKGGTLRLLQSNFLTAPPEIPNSFDLSIAESNFNPHPDQKIFIPEVIEDLTIPHIASPDVHVDQENKKIIMYYHGLEKFGVQSSRVATSNDGINFIAEKKIIGKSYFRKFEYENKIYGMSMPGIFYINKGKIDEFEEIKTLFNKNMRHSALIVIEHKLYVFYTQRGDAPEKILLSVIDLDKEPKKWDATKPIEVTRPEFEWEGANLPIQYSSRSSINTPVNQLRDPCVFQDEGKLYLLYSVKGENGIAISTLEIN